MVDEWDILDAKLKAAEAKVSDPMAPAKTAALAQVVASIRTDFAADRTALRVTSLPRYNTVIQRIWNDIEPDRTPRKMWESLVLQFGGGGMIGLFVLVATFIGVGILMAFYVSGAGFAELRTIEGARPLLTIAAIVATLAFGGGLVFAALFADDAAFETRFRMAREIFLVFSGVFATVVGFHFGAATSSAPQAPLAISTMEEKDGKLTISLKGGVAPFRVELTADNQSPKLFSFTSQPMSVDHGFDAKTRINRLRVRIIDKNLQEEVQDAADFMPGTDFSWPRKASTAPSNPARPPARGASQPR